MLLVPGLPTSGLVAFGDDDDDRLHVASGTLSLAGPDGSIRLLRWADAGSSAATGALFSIDLTVAPSTAEIAAAGLDEARVRALDWLDVVVEIDLPGLPTVRTPVTPVGGAASVVAELDAAATGVLAALLDDDATGSPVMARWTGEVRGRLPPVEVSASVDEREVRARIVDVRGDEVREATRSLVTMLARVNIRGSAGPAVEMALRDWAFDELTRLLASNEPAVVEVSAAEVVRWPVVLAATVDLAGAGQAVVQDIVLSADEVDGKRPLEVRVFGEFGERLDRVDVEVSAADSTTTAIIIADDRPHLRRITAGPYRWRHRIRRDGITGSWSTWSDASGAALIVPVADQRSVVLEIVADALDFQTRWRDVAVEVSTPDRIAADRLGVVVLDATRRSSRLSVPTADVRAEATFTSRNGHVMAQEVPVAGDGTVLVTDPYRDRIVRTLLPSGTGWTDVALAMVDLRLRRSTAPPVDETVALRSFDDVVTWTAPAADSETIVSWRAHISFRSGRFVATDWIDSVDPIIIVHVDGPPTRVVHVLPLRQDFATIATVEVRLRSGGDDHHITFSDRTPAEFRLPPGPYSVSTRWTLRDGQVVESTDSADQDVLVIPRPP